LKITEAQMPQWNVFADALRANAASMKGMPVTHEQESRMDKMDEKGSQGSPMQMGMAMANKMMAQMGQGGSPFEMMQKMMAQMGRLSYRAG
jgi:hypothetical protein